VKARVEDTLLEAVKEAFKTITAENCAGWFSHAGYAIAAKLS